MLLTTTRVVAVTLFLYIRYVIRILQTVISLRCGNVIDFSFLCLLETEIYHQYAVSFGWNHALRSTC